MFLIGILEFRLAFHFSLIEANIRFRACKQNIGTIGMGGGGMRELGWVDGYDCCS